MHNPTGASRRVLLSLLVALVLVQVLQVNAANPDYVGYVYDDETSEAISDAKVTVRYRRYYRWYSSRWYISTSTTTDANGRFELNLNNDYGYLFLISYEVDGEHEYVPFTIYHNPDGSTVEEEIRLCQAEKVTLEGRDFFIETTAIPDITVRIVNPESHDPIDYGALGLYYGTRSGTLSTFLNIPTGTIYAPRDKEYSIKVTAYVEKDGEPLTDTILLEGDALTSASVNLRSKVLPKTLEKIQNITETTEALLIEKESQGFFLSVERQKLARAETLTSTAVNQMESDALEESFTKLREAYVILWIFRDQSPAFSRQLLSQCLS